MLLDYNLIAKKIAPSVEKITVLENPKLLNKFSTSEISLSAFTYIPIPHNYTIYYREISPIIFCHEMIHIFQYERGDLECTKDYSFMWQGECYDKSFPYEDRPWEIEAFNNQRKLYRQWKHLFKKS